MDKMKILGTSTVYYTIDCFSHRLEYFENLDITEIVKDTSTIGSFWEQDC